MKGTLSTRTTLLMSELEELARHKALTRSQVMRRGCLVQMMAPAAVLVAHR